MKKQHDKVEEKKQANVADGDTRPDKPEAPFTKRTHEEEKPVTAERGADINSTEDARDARQGSGR